MFRLFKAPTYFTTASRRAGHHAGNASNYCRKLSTAPIQQGRKGPASSDCTSLSELKEKWFNRFQELDDNWSKRLKEVDSLCLKCSEELDAMRSERSKKDLDFLHKETGSLVQLKKILTIREAVASVVTRAKVRGMIPWNAGIQEGLNELAKQKEFTEILKDEVKDRKLSVKKVMASLHRLESLVSKTPCLDGLTVTVPSAVFTKAERAALIILFKLQDDFSESFWYEEEEKPDEGDSDSGSDSESTSEDDCPDYSDYSDWDR